MERKNEDPTLVCEVGCWWGLVHPEKLAKRQIQFFTSSNFPRCFFIPNYNTVQLIPYLLIAVWILSGALQKTWCLLSTICWAQITGMHDRSQCKHLCRRKATLWSIPRHLSSSLAPPSSPRSANTLYIARKRDPIICSLWSYRRGSSWSCWSVFFRKSS
jgi:hypothetical protein